MLKFGKALFLVTFRAKGDTRLRRSSAIAIAAFSGLGLVFCDQLVTDVERTAPVPQFSVDSDCPPGTIGTPDCPDEPPTQNQVIKIYSAISNIADTEYCKPYKDRAMQAYINEEFFVFDGADNPPYTYFGDQHTYPVRTHIDPRNFLSNHDLMDTIIHEMAHAVNLDLTEYDAKTVAEQCLGNLEGW